MIILHALSALPFLERFACQQSARCEVNLEEGSASISELQMLEGELDRRFVLRSPVHLIVGDAFKTRKSPWFVCHSWTRSLPPESFIRITGSAYAPSPELCFLQMAELLKPIELIRLGYELCSSYRLDPREERGFDTRAPLSLKARLAAFLEKVVDCAAARRAIDALPLIADASASPRETTTALLCSLPASLGGWAFPAPYLNTPVETPAGMRRIDLFWPDWRYGLEYDSDAEHANASAIAHDSLREKELELMGLQLDRITAAELRNERSRELLYRTLCKRFGRKWKRPSEKTAFLRRRLAAALLAPHATMV